MHPPVQSQGSGKPQCGPALRTVPQEHRPQCRIVPRQQGQTLEEDVLPLLPVKAAHMEHKEVIGSQPERGPHLISRHPFQAAIQVGQVQVVGMYPDARQPELRLVVPADVLAHGQERGSPEVGRTAVEDPPHSQETGPLLAIVRVVKGRHDGASPPCGDPTRHVGGEKVGMDHVRPTATDRASDLVNRPAKVPRPRQTEFDNLDIEVSNGWSEGIRSE